MMFAILPAPALTDRRLLASDLRVLGAIRTFTRPDRPTCWPSRAAIGARCGITSESRVSKVLGRLESLGWIQITRRQGSSVYHVFDAPQVPTGQPCTLVCSPAVHTGVQLEEIREETNYIPLTPRPDNVTVTDNQAELIHCYTSLDAQAETAIGEPIAINPDPETERQPDSAVEECHQAEQTAESAHREAVERPESTPSRKPKPDPEQRQIAIQAVLNAFKQQSGIDYSNRAAIQRKIARRIDRYGVQAVLQAVESKAGGLHHPAVILRPSTLEAAIAEIQRDREAALERARRDREAIEAMRQPSSNRTREGAARGIQSLKQALGMRPKPDDDPGQLRA